MSGRGKGGKGLGKGGTKGFKRGSGSVSGITKPAIRRLARRGGVKRISGTIYDEARGVVKTFLESVVKDAVTYTEYSRRKTVTALDVVYALKRQGRTIYGFGDTCSSKSLTIFLSPKLAKYNLLKETLKFTFCTKKINSKCIEMTRKRGKQKQGKVKKVVKEKNLISVKEKEETFTGE
ncbi:histone H4 replacement-like protein [Reticulomyxa filosa]|uniref:Histone H4 n=1 Tax=Reticulomyxa filosa TaxID=46433 RepID=X6MES2_RETFI|nr:histone H4 replacement-like protein [Reticulomyxa filosa]|eukprot:ETO12523.1 histone H4 replacement-like protein [Reticulomyxa filosa]